MTIQEAICKLQEPRKGLIAVYEVLLQTNKKKRNNPHGIQTKDMSRQFTEKKVQKTRKHEKDIQIYYQSKKYKLTSEGIYT